MQIFANRAMAMDDSVINYFFSLLFSYVNFCTGINQKLFDTLKESFSNVLPKMVAVEGDVTQLGLGLSVGDVKKMENVSVIFHAAASVR
jgi:Male sterility protein